MSLTPKTLELIGLVFSQEVVAVNNYYMCFTPSGDDVNRKFSIDEVTGLIETTANELDRETRATYVLTVSATDSGTPQRMVCTSTRARAGAIVTWAESLGKPGLESSKCNMQKLE